MLPILLSLLILGDVARTARSLGTGRYGSRQVVGLGFGRRCTVHGTFWHSGLGNGPAMYPLTPLKTRSYVTRYLAVCFVWGRPFGLRTTPSDSQSCLGFHISCQSSPDHTQYVIASSALTGVCTASRSLEERLVPRAASFEYLARYK